MTKLLLVISLLTTASITTAKQKRALILGISGQDGAYLTKFLLEKDYHITGIIRKNSYLTKLTKILGPTQNSYNNKVVIQECDLLNYEKVHDLIVSVEPDEIYNFWSQSSVYKSLNDPIGTMRTNAMSFLNIVEAARNSGRPRDIKIFNACSSEMLGGDEDLAKNESSIESSIIKPKNPYGLSKICSFLIAKYYRATHNQFICNGFLFNHESPLRNYNYVSKKIVRCAIEIKMGIRDSFYLGNLDCIRDWGFAQDFVEGMWLMLQQNQAEDYVLATGKGHSVRDFVNCAFAHLEMEIDWHGEGIDTRGTDPKTGKTIIKVLPELFRPNDIGIVGDYCKAKETLQWTPKTNLKDLVGIMIKDEIKDINQSTLNQGEK